MKINPFYFPLWHISNITYSPFQSSNLDSETSCSGPQTILSNFLHKILHRLLFHSLYVLRVNLCTHLKIVSLSITRMIWSTSLVLDRKNSTVISKLRASASPLFINGEAVWAGRASGSRWGSIRNEKRCRDVGITSLAAPFPPRSGYPPTPLQSTNQMGDDMVRSKSSRRGNGLGFESLHTSFAAERNIRCCQERIAVAKKEER
jgi:hypothetical protein